MGIKRVWLLFLLLTLAMSVSYAQDEPGVSAELFRSKGDELLLTVYFQLPADYHIYAESLQVSAGSPAGIQILPARIPSPEKFMDAATGLEIVAYKHDFNAQYQVIGLDKAGNLVVTVSYQGCSGSVCFLPQSRTFDLSVKRADHKAGRRNLSSESPLSDEEAEWRKWADEYVIIKHMTGFMTADDFLKKLNSSDEASSFADKSIWAIVLLILMGGFALNLTPCILPLIPVNLAIIGAGAKASSRKQGFFTGGIYGLGMACAYGILGVFIVLTGSTLGTLNASPWFNAVICFIFVLLALGMFGFFNMDLTRFRPKAQPGKGRRNIFLPFFMGAVVALLAGACIAPVVLSVLLLSGQMYARGQIIGLFLPFILGIGMGLPWPFAGAGLSFLPKPGKWMNKVKNGFGILILLLAVYYGYLAFSLFQSRGTEVKISSKSVELSVDHKGWMTDLETAFKKADHEKKPVFIDFWASWCKNCRALEKRTFSDPEVRRILNSYIKVKFQAENPSDLLIKEVLDHFGVKGLPTMIVLKKRE